MAFLHVLGVRWLAALLLAGHAALGFFTGTTQALPVPITPSNHSPAPASLATSSIITTLPAPPQPRATTTTPASPLPTQVVSKSDSPAPPPIAPTTPQGPSLSQDQADKQTRAALVNILCTTEAGGYFNPLSGSGVIVDSHGIILTNAHVAQYFLLRNYPVANNVQCVVRTGNPAQPRYTAQLLYLPPIWVDANASKIGQHNPTGSGENDYAFLRITGTTNGSPLPASFANLTMTTDDPSTGEPVLLAAYPAELLDGTTIQENLFIISAITAVGQLFSFDSTSTVDLVSVAGTIVSQEGSSGGAVIRLQDGALNGIIATESQGTTTASRDLRAITLGHIDRSLAAEGQGGIATLLTGDLAGKSADFLTTIAPQETSELEAVLDTH